MIYHAIPYHVGYVLTLCGNGITYYYMLGIRMLLHTYLYTTHILRYIPWYAHTPRDAPDAP